MEPNFDGRRAFVVGGSGGIGAEVTLSLARSGASVCIHGGHDGARIAAVAARAAQSGGPHETLLLELSGPADVPALLRAAGDPDILVVAFGPFLESPVGETSTEQWRRMIDCNLTLPAGLISAVVPGMVARGYGRIVVFGAPRSDRLEGYRDIAAYGAAKHGLASLVRSVAKQYAGHNIRCNMICPGYVDTEYYSPAARAELLARHPVGRMVSTAEIAGLVIQLLSSASDAVNGAIIPVDFGV